MRPATVLQILQSKRLYCLKLPLETPSPIYTAHHFCLPLILSLQPLELPKGSPVKKEKVETMWSGVGAMKVHPSPGLLVPSALVSGPSPSRWAVLIGI